MNQKSITGMSLLGGLGLGAILMYVLDPEVGNQRRQRISRAATDAMHEAGGTLSQAVNELSGKAGELRQKIHDHATEIAAAATQQIDAAHGSAEASMSGLGDHLRDTAHRLGEAISRRAANAASGAGAYGASARKYAERVRAFGRSHMRQKRVGISPRGAGISAAGALAIGAAAMFLLDPAEGRRRRGVIGKSVSEAVSAAGSTCHTAGQFVRNQWDRIFSSQEAGDGSKEERWESELHPIPPVSTGPEAAVSQPSAM